MRYILAASNLVLALASTKRFSQYATTDHQTGVPDSEQNNEVLELPGDLDSRGKSQEYASQAPFMRTRKDSMEDASVHPGRLQSLDGVSSGSEAPVNSDGDEDSAASRSIESTVRSRESPTWKRAADSLSEDDSDSGDVTESGDSSDYDPVGDAVGRFADHWRMHWIAPLASRFDCSDLLRDKEFARTYGSVVIAISRFVNSMARRNLLWWLESKPLFDRIAEAGWLISAEGVRENEKFVRYALKQYPDTLVSTEEYQRLWPFLLKLLGPTERDESEHEREFRKMFVMRFGQQKKFMDMFKELLRQGQKWFAGTSKDAFAQSLDTATAFSRMYNPYLDIDRRPGKHPNPEQARIEARKRIDPANFGFAEMSATEAMRALELDAPSRPNDGSDEVFELMNPRSIIRFNEENKRAIKKQIKRGREHVQRLHDREVLRNKIRQYIFQRRAYQAYARSLESERTGLPLKLKTARVRFASSRKAQARNQAKAEMHSDTDSSDAVSNDSLQSFDSVNIRK